MNSIKQFNRILNSDDYNRFEQWEFYRNELTKFILDNSNKSNGSTLILGVGNSDDLDLSKLSKLTESITLSDIDNKSLNKTFKKYSLDPKKSIKLNFDYTGLDKNINWNNFIDIMIKAKGIKAIDYNFNRLSLAIKNYSFPITQKYDLVIVSPIYTQLVFQQGLSNINILHNLNYPENLLNYIKEKLLWLMQVVIDTFNDNVISTLHENSTLFVISDVFEANLNSIFYKETTGLKNIESIYKNYQEKYGIGIGDYGLINMNEKLKINTSKWFEWPFSSDKTFFVKVALYK
jgi:hypothetical protein